MAGGKSTMSWLTVRKEWLLVLFFALVYLLPLNERPLWTPDETRYAEISREMLESGNWSVPHLLGVHYFEKPVAGYWLNAISQMVFGFNNFAVRFASAFSAGLSALLVYCFAFHLWRRRQTAQTSTLIYLSSLLVAGVGSYAVLDSMLSLWLNLALVAFYRFETAPDARTRLAWSIVLGLASGMGFLMKGFLALLIPVIVAVPYALYRKHPGRLLGFGLVAILCAFLLCLPWAWRVHERAPDFWNYFFWIEHVQRFAQENAQHKAPFWYYVPVIILGIIPWLGIVPLAVHSIGQYIRQRDDIVFLVLWFVIPTLFFSVAKGKLPTYVLPCFMPLALLLGWGVENACQKNGGQTRFLSLNGWVNVALACLVFLFLSVDYFRPEGLLYTPGDQRAFLTAVIACAAWGAFGWMALIRKQKYWRLAALCPMVVALFVGWLLPQKTLNNRLPEVFISAHHELLSRSPVLATNNPGLATALAWSMQRTDIVQIGKMGELGYGIRRQPVGTTEGTYAVSDDELASWLSQARRKGDVAFVTFKWNKPDSLPPADTVQQQYHLMLLLYRKTEP